MKKVRLIVLFLTLSMLLTALPVSASEPLLIAPAPTAKAPILIAPAPTAPIDSSWLLPAINPLPEFPDVAGTWCAAAVDVAYQVGLADGKSADFFDIRGPLTYAQITVITARFHDLLNGGDGILPEPSEVQKWYQPAVEYLTANCKDATLQTLLHYLDLDSRRADSPCIRRDFVWMLAAILPQEALTPINEIPAVPDSISDHVREFYQAGILNGYDAYGSFREEDPLTRGAACAILARIIDPAQRLTISLKSFDLCRDVLGVEPSTILLTADGRNITAEMFAWQLCAALYGQAGDGAAIADAISFWCNYDAPFHLLSEEKGVTLSGEKLAQILETATGRDGYQAMSAAYWQHQLEAAALNAVLLDTYSAADPKYGKHACADDLAAISSRLAPSTIPTEALTSLDLAAVYQRLMSSPWTSWVMLSP